LLSALFYMVIVDFSRYADLCPMKKDARQSRQPACLGGSPAAELDELGIDDIDLLVRLVWVDEVVAEIQGCIERK
jgi:hypothetical protein